MHKWGASSLHHIPKSLLKPILDREIRILLSACSKFEIFCCPLDSEVNWGPDSLFTWFMNKLNTEEANTIPCFTSLLMGILLVKHPEVPTVNWAKVLWSSRKRNNSYFLIFILPSFDHKQDQFMESNVAARSKNTTYSAFVPFMPE